MTRNEDYCPISELQNESAEIREAVIHFELYRTLMNVIAAKSKFSSIEYVCFHPEYLSLKNV